MKYKNNIREKLNFYYSIYTITPYGHIELQEVHKGNCKCFFSGVSKDNRQITYTEMKTKQSNNR